MRVCVVAEYYPRRRDPVLGIWAHRQTVAARDAGAEVRVLVLERPVPALSSLRTAVRGHPRRVLHDLSEMRSQPRHDTIDGIEVEYVRYVAPPREQSYASWHRFAMRPLTRALERLHSSWPFDLVHAHYALPAGGAALPFTRKHGMPLVISVHGGDVLGPLMREPEARARVGAVLREASSVLCNSRGTLVRTAAVAGSTRHMRVVHLGAEIPNELPPRHEQPTLATLGHVIPRKRHEDVLRALARLRDKLPELRWVVVGEGPERPRLEQLARDLGVWERVRFPGQLPHSAALDELARCHLMVLPSVDEAFGVAYAEALARSVPAIGCAGEGGPEEIAASGGGIVLVPPRDPPSLATTIASLLSDPPRLAELGEVGRETVREHFSWERCGQQTVDAYERAVAEARA